MLKYYNVYIIMSFVLVSCFYKTENFFDKGKKIIEYIGEQRKDSIFLNLSISTRGIKDEETNKYPIRGFLIHKNDNSTITLPPHNVQMTLVDIDSSKWLESIKKFANYHNIDEEQAIEFYIKYSKKVVLLFNQLEIPQLYSNPNLGSFIVYELDPYYDLVHLYSKEDLKSAYWVHFFDTAEEIQKGWYYRKKN